MSEQKLTADTLSGELKTEQAELAVKSFRISCSKHKDVTNATVNLNFASKTPEGTVKEHHYIYCLACINELLSEFQKDGKIGKISITPIYQKVDGDQPS